MLSAELSESLRRNLLWERQNSKRNPQREALKPYSTIDVELPLEIEKTPEKAEPMFIAPRKGALDRSRSWADIYHSVGW